MYVVFAIAIFAQILCAFSDTTSTNELCYGPDYPTHPFDLENIVLLYDMCITFQFDDVQNDDASQTSLTVGLTYNDKLYDQIVIYENNPNSNEQKLCFDVPQHSPTCELCVGFGDIYMGFTWAEVCPKLFASCKMPSNETNTDYQFAECLLVGNGTYCTLCNVLFESTNSQIEVCLCVFGFHVQIQRLIIKFHQSLQQTQISTLIYYLQML